MQDKSVIVQVFICTSVCSRKNNGSSLSLALLLYLNFCLPLFVGKGLVFILILQYYDLAAEN